MLSSLSETTIGSSRVPVDNREPVTPVVRGDEGVPVDDEEPATPIVRGDREAARLRLRV